jgi:SMI1 / KNR4 family (SUKH-1)
MRLGWPGKRDQREAVTATDWTPAGVGLLSGLFTPGGASRDQIARAQERLGVTFPSDLEEFMAQADAAEGWVGDAYLAMWPVALLADLNAKARIPEFAPDLVFFATNGGGEGFAFDRSNLSFVMAPMIGLRIVESTPMGGTFRDFVDRLAPDHPIDAPVPAAGPSQRGLVVYEITPIILGGSPTDPANKRLVPLDRYVEMVGWWNERLASRDTFGMPDGGPLGQP